MRARLVTEPSATTDKTSKVPPRSGRCDEVRIITNQLCELVKLQASAHRNPAHGFSIVLEKSAAVKRRKAGSEIASVRKKFALAPGLLTATASF